MKSIACMLLGSGVAVALSGMASANHIDFIEDGPFFLFIDPNNPSASTTVTGDSGNILGGERFVMLEYVGTPSGIVDSAFVDGGSSLFFDNGATALGRLMLGYGMTADLNSDFDTMWDLVAINFDFVDGSGLLTLEVTGGGTTGSVSQVVNSAGTYNFLFSDAGFAGVDFGDVDQVKVTLEAQTAAADFSITQITREIPAPGALALLGMAGLIARRRRRTA